LEIEIEASDWFGEDGENATSRLDSKEGDAVGEAESGGVALAILRALGDVGGVNFCGREFLAKAMAMRTEPVRCRRW